MTAAQLRTLLETYGLSQRGAAKLVGIGERTMRGYVSGERPIPRAIDCAIRYVALTQTVKGLKLIELAKS